MKMPFRIRAELRCTLILKTMLVCSLLFTSLKGAEPNPVLVVNSYPNLTDRGVFEWDCPVFVAYSDGMAIWRKGWARSLDAFVAACDESTVPLVRKLHELTALYNGKVFTLTASSDPEITTIWSEGKVIRIEGDWRRPHVVTTGNAEDAAAYASTNRDEQRRWSQLPAELREVLSGLSSLNDTVAKSWRPTKLMVTLIPGGLGEPVEWPADWPRNFIPVSEQPGIIQAEFPGDMLEPLLNLLARDGQPRAVRFAGKRMYGRIGILFPQQSVWTQRE